MNQKEIEMLVKDASAMMAVPSVASFVVATDVSAGEQDILSAVSLPSVQHSDLIALTLAYHIVVRKDFQLARLIFATSCFVDHLQSQCHIDWLAFMTEYEAFMRENFPQDYMSPEF